MGNQVEKLRLSGKEKIIESAIALLEKKQPDLNLDYSDYEITVWTNSTSVLVKFRSLFRIFLPENSEVIRLICDFTVDLINNEVIPFDLYSLTEYEKRIIGFVKENTTLPYPIKKDYTYEIYDREGHYDIYIRLNGSFTNYHIDKITGQHSGYNELNANPAEIPEINMGDLDPLEELH